MQVWLGLVSGTLHGSGRRLVALLANPLRGASLDEE